MSDSEKPSSPSVTETGAWESGGGEGEERDLTGRTLGDFQIERMLGRGGMGEVYLARQISLNRPVALKVLRPELLSKPTYLSRFEAEATAVARLNHPNIVHVYMLGHVEGIRFIAMEYVQGTNLRDYILKKGALDLPLALSIMKQAAVAVGAAGELGLVHRDIKPENLLLTRKGQVKVADFGLCRDQDSEGIHLTQPGITLGTPQYMSPEQAQGHALDHRSDLYSLGVTFYHMLTGEPPFRGETALAVALKHVKDVPVSPAARRPEIPLELDRLVMKLMAKKPGDRYQSASEMLRDLSKVREVLHAPSVAVPVSELTPAADGGVVSTLRATGAEARPRPRPAPRPAGPPLRERLAGFRLHTGQLAALVGVCLAAGLAWGWLTRPPDLLAERAPQPAKAMPGLWMSPDWGRIPRQNGPEAQYHYAQLRVSQSDQEAAWLAVPGNFPSSREWASKAYTQLARALLRRRDLDRLRVLAAELARWDTGRVHDRELAVIVRAAADALEGKIEEVITELGPKSLEPDVLIDPALLELSLEVASQAQVASREGGAGVVPPGLARIQETLVRRLYNHEFREALGRRRPS